ncbi:hypothetical protein NMY22_g9965 [Coprinellus aureogranulatus]|nr:hypothetical protein NMY22_g9965 [Coprinellus aureogranulatus]
MARIDLLLDTALTYITRSKRNLLSVNVELRALRELQSLRRSNFPEDTHDKIYVLYCGLLDILCSASDRWREISLDFAFGNDIHEAQDCLCTLYSLEPKNVPFLQRIHVSASSGGLYDKRLLPEKFSRFMKGDSIRSVVIPFLHSSWRDFQVRWPLLTELRFIGARFSPSPHERIKYFGAGAALTLLRQCPNLVECHLAIRECGYGGVRANQDDGDPLQAGDLAVVTLPRLRVLGLHGIVKDIDLPTFLALPSLRDLRFSRDHKFGLEADTLETWLRRFGHQLEALRFVVEPSWTAGINIRQMLGHIPNVKSLRVITYPSQAVNWHFLAALTPPPAPKRGSPAHPCLCPDLRELIFDSLTKARSLPQRELLELIQLRGGAGFTRDGVSALETVRIRSRIPLDFDLVGELRKGSMVIPKLSICTQYSEVPDPGLYDGWVDEDIDEMWSPYKSFVKCRFE